MKHFGWVAAMLLSTAAHANDAGERKFVENYVAQTHFSGVIAVAHAGRISYEQAFGLADIPFHVANTTHTKFRIASVTKAFTAVLIMQLVEQGKIDPAKTIKTYLPEYTGPAGDLVTVYQLLNHTSGLTNFDQVGDATEATRTGLPNYQHPWTSDQLITQYCSGPLLNTPGTKFSYNNGDYVLLGKIIERVSGESWERVLADKILTPLGMTSSGVLHQSDIVDGLAEAYFFRDDLHALANDLPVYPENWYAAGAMYSTTDDLLKFSSALFGHKLIGPAALKAMLKGGLDDYGYGVWSYDTKIRGQPHAVVKRPGRIMGAQAQFFHVMSPDITLLVLNNASGGDLDQFVADLAKVAVP